MVENSTVRSVLTLTYTPELNWTNAVRRILARQLACEAHKQQKSLQHQLVEATSVYAASFYCIYSAADSEEFGECLPMTATRLGAASTYVSL